MEHGEHGHPVKGMFSSIVSFYGEPLPVLLKTKQHLIPISANIPYQAYEAVLLCRVIPR